MSAPTFVPTPRRQRRGRRKIGTEADVQRLLEVSADGVWACYVSRFEDAERLRGWALRAGRNAGVLLHTRWDRSEGVLTVERWRRATVPNVGGGRGERSGDGPLPLRAGGVSYDPAAADLTGRA